MDKTKEWIPLKGYETYSINRNGEIINFKTGALVKGSDRNGYKRFTYHNKNLSIHKLVYETFIGPIPNNMYIDHIDGDRSNNKIENLRLVSQSENMKNAMANGHAGQVPVLQFDKNGNFIQEFPNIQAAADSINRTHAAIRSAIERGGKSGGFIGKRRSNNY